MPVKNWKDRGSKGVARELALSFMDERRRAIMMPAAEALDVKKALEMGIFDKNTEIICVDRDRDEFKQMKATMSKLGLRGVSHNCEIHKVPLGQKIDFLFLDLNGVITREVAEWLTHTVSPMLVEGAAISITLEKAVRNNNFPILADQYFVKNSPGRRGEIIEEFNCNDVLCTAIQIVEHCLSDWDFNIHSKFPEYNDGQAMVLLLVRRIRRRKTANSEKPGWVKFIGDRKVKAKSSSAQMRAVSMERSPELAAALAEVDRNIKAWTNKRMKLGENFKINGKAIKMIVAGYKSFKTKLITGAVQAKAS